VAFSLLLSYLVSGLRVPLSTYRLQFNSRFTFRDAQAIVDYLRGLGITDCYASSYLAAVPGSPHGYDVADPTRLNPEIGSDEDYSAWIAALQAHGMGHLLDVVPNHMGIAKSANPWWLDVLENGQGSRYAHFFDIEWHPVKDELAHKVLIPILGDQYGAVLERQELKLVYQQGAFFVRYYDERLPIAPDTYSSIVGDALDEWLDRHRGDDADELQSVLTAADHLPPRTSHDPEDIAVRAREKEVVKRRLAALTARSAAVNALMRSCVHTFNGVAHQPRSFDRLDELLNAQSYGSRIGALRRRRSTIAASSTSTSSPRCAWKIPRSSMKCTGSSSSWRTARRRPDCASITSMASSRRATTCGGCRTT